MLVDNEHREIGIGAPSKEETLELEDVTENESAKSSSSPVRKNDSIEKGRSDNESFEDPLADPGVRPVGNAHSLKPPSVPKNVSKVFETKITEVVSSKLKDSSDALVKASTIPNLNVDIIKCEKNMWYQCPNLKHISNYYKVEYQ